MSRSVYLNSVTLDEARLRLETALREVGRWEALTGESVTLAEALGRVTAEPTWAKVSAPHYHAAAMDGYAVRASDTHLATERQPVSLRLDEQAFPVDTGDPLPAGLDAVIMIEDVQQSDTTAIEIRASVAPRQHVRLMGEDMVETELVQPVNHRIRPVDLGALAGCGYETISVRRRPFVVIIPTGDELVPPGQRPQPGQIIEYNSLVLSGQITQAGGMSHVTAITPDDPKLLRLALQAALQQQPDLILILSGSSAGSQDFTASLIREVGTLLVHGIAVRPGHPVIFGMVETVPVIGVPGYPVSAALTGDLLVQPLLAHWLGQPSIYDNLPRVQAVMTHKVTSPAGDDDFVRVTLAQVGERLLATPLNRGAGVITSLVKADGLAHIPRFSEGVNTGSSIEVVLYRALDSIQRTVLLSGSHDPMLDLLGQETALQFPGYRLVCNPVGSTGGLVALKRDEAHLAGTHLLDPATGEFNLPYLPKYLSGEVVRVVTFAHREQGFIVAKGNPLGIRSVEDLVRVRFVNRQRGAGTRVLLDYELQRRGIAPEVISGYDHEEYTHLAAAAAVASGTADCAVGVLSAATALKLDFVPLTQERYDLVLPEKYVAQPAVAAVLDTLVSAKFRQILSAQPGYDTHQTGQTIAT